jgi:hypothetical protein
MHKSIIIDQDGNKVCEMKTLFPLPKGTEVTTPFGRCRVVSYEVMYRNWRTSPWGTKIRDVVAEAQAIF